MLSIKKNQHAAEARRASRPPGASGQPTTVTLLGWARHLHPLKYSTPLGPGPTHWRRHPLLPHPGPAGRRRWASRGGAATRTATTTAARAALRCRRPRWPCSSSPSHSSPRRRSPTRAPASPPPPPAGSSAATRYGWTLVTCLGRHIRAARSYCNFLSSSVLSPQTNGSGGELEGTESGQAFNVAVRSQCVCNFSWFIFWIAHNSIQIWVDFFCSDFILGGLGSECTTPSSLVLGE